MAGRASAGAREFDVSAYRSHERLGSNPMVRFMIVLGLAFTAAGAGVGFYAATQVQGAGWGALPLLTGLFAFGGFSPLLLIFLPGRPWRWLRAVRVGPDGFDLVLSSGAPISHPWDEPALAFSVQQELATPPSAATGVPRGERLLVAPRLMTHNISAEAREALLFEAAAHGFQVSEEPLDVRTGSRSDPPVPVIERVAWRGFLGGVTAPLPTPPGPLATGGNVAGGGTVTFDLSATPAPTRDPTSSLASPPAMFRTVTVSDATLSFVTRHGRSVTCDWNTPGLSLWFSRSLEAPGTPFSSPTATWFLAIRKPDVSGQVPAACYAAIVATARRVGLECSSYRFPAGRRLPGLWRAYTTLRRPGPGR